MDKFWNITGEIIEMLSLVDAPTAYLLIFTPAWLLFLIVITVIFRKRKKDFFKILAFIPLLNFAVFYLINATWGNQLFGFLRYCPHLAAAIIYCIASLVIARGKRKVLPLIISGFLGLCLTVWSAVYVLALGSAYHLGNFTRYGYEKSMACLITELEKNYVLRDYKEIDFDSLRQKYIPLAAEAEKNKDEDAFAAAVANLCYEFHDGHLSIRLTDENLSVRVRQKLAGNDYGFSMIRTDEGKTLVILAEEDSEAYRSGIRDGVEITAWDGVEINEAISQVRCVQFVEFLCAFPLEENEEIVKPIFLAGQGGDQVKVKFIGEDGIEKEVTLTTTGSYFGRLYRAVYPLTAKQHEEFCYSEMLDEHCGYICIPRESYDPANDISAALNDEYPEIKELMISKVEELKKQGMDRLVLDIRGNDGGIDVIYEEIVSLFADKMMVTYGGFYDGTQFRKSENWAWVIEPDGRYSDIPVVVLVNAGCASSGDLLAYRLSLCPNVTMMGITNTWGSSQALGGECILTGGNITVRYPMIASLDDNDQVIVDAGKDRKSSIVLDEKIPLDYGCVKILYYVHGDYDLAYARYYLNNKLDA